MLVTISVGIYELKRNIVVQTNKVGNKPTLLVLVCMYTDINDCHGHYRY